MKTTFLTKSLRTGIGIWGIFFLSLPMVHAQGLGDELKDFVREYGSVELEMTDDYNFVYFSRILQRLEDNLMASIYYFDDDYRCFSIKIVQSNRTKARSLWNELTTGAYPLSDTVRVHDRYVVWWKDRDDIYIIQLILRENFEELLGIREEEFQEQLLKSVREE